MENLKKEVVLTDYILGSSENTAGGSTKNEKVNNQGTLENRAIILPFFLRATKLKCIHNK